MGTQQNVFPPSENIPLKFKFYLLTDPEICLYENPTITIILTGLFAVKVIFCKI